MEQPWRIANREKAVRILVERSDLLTKAASVERAFDTSVLSPQDVIDCIAATFRNPKSKLRLFVENQMVDGVLLSRYRASLPSPGETLEDWSVRVFGRRKFGVVLNDLESFHEPLVKKMVPFIEKILRNWGYPLGGLELCLFVGNYGFTPFGAHTDPHLDGGLHFMLGPGTKAFYHWSTDGYLSANGSLERCVEPSPQLLQAARRHSLRAGDIFYLPGEGFHVAESAGITASLLLAFRRYNYLVRSAIRHIEKQLCERNYHRAVINTPPTSTQQVNVELHQPLQVDGELRARDWLGESVHFAFLRRLSNLGLGPASPRPEASFQLHPESVITVNNGFPLLLWVGGRKDVGSILFARGHEVDVSFVPAIAEFVEALNAGELSQLASWDAHFQDTNTTDRGRQLLWKLYKFRGICIKQPSENPVM